MSFRGNDSEEDREKFISDLTSLWNDVVAHVYLKEGELSRERVLYIWEHTKYTPLDYVKFYGDPKALTNIVERGQKAREKRWEKWLRAIEVSSAGG